MLWGRKETIIWPPHGPINTYGALLLSIAAAHSLLIYILASVSRHCSSTTYPITRGRRWPGRCTKLISTSFSPWSTTRNRIFGIATEKDVISGTTAQYEGKPLSLQISPRGIADGYQFVFASAQDFLPK